MIVMDLELLLSIALGIIFLASAIPKLRYPRGFILAVLEYRVLPTRLSWVYARLLPPLELLLALLLLTGTALRAAAVVTALLLLSCITAVGINLARGRDLNCHCFGKSTSRPIGWSLLLQDATLLGMVLAIAFVSGEWAALEPWSVFRLSGLVQAGSLWPLLVCVAVTVCTAALLSRSTDGKRWYRSEVAK